VYRFAPAASRHVATTQRDDIDAHFVARERARRARSAADSKNHCEMGISSMSENACTTPTARLDSIYSDAANAARDFAAPDFRGENICEQVGRRSDFGRYRACASKRKACESVSPIREDDRSEHAGKPVDSVGAAPIAPIPDLRKRMRTVARGAFDRVFRRSPRARRARKAVRGRASP
jgi:hypothetical protein